MLVEVTVRVPEERVGDFYLMHGQWLQSLGQAEAQPGREEWSSKDVSLASEMKKALPANSAALLDLLVRKESLTTEEVAHELGLDVSQVTGVAGWVGRVANTVNRRSPIKTRQVDGSTEWRVERNVSKLFK
jgi:hypothetical protein